MFLSVISVFLSNSGARISTSLSGPNHNRWLLILSLLSSPVCSVVLSLAIILRLFQVACALDVSLCLLVHLRWSRLVVSLFPLGVIPVSVVLVSLWPERKSAGWWLLVVLSVAWLVLGWPGSVLAKVVLVAFERQLLLLSLPGFQLRGEEFLEVSSLLLELLVLIRSHIIFELTLGGLHGLELILRSLLGWRDLLALLGLELGGLVVSLLEPLLLGESLLPELLLVIIIFEVIVEPGRRPEALENGHHPLACFWINFLAVSALASWLILVEWVLNVDELGVGDVLDVNPLYSEGSRPLSWLFP